VSRQKTLGLIHRHKANRIKRQRFLPDCGFMRELAVCVCEQVRVKQDLRVQCAIELEAGSNGRSLTMGKVKLERPVRRFNPGCYADPRESARENWGIYAGIRRPRGRALRSNLPKSVFFPFGAVSDRVQNIAGSVPNFNARWLISGSKPRVADGIRDRLMPHLVR
jgi:hypothetical protein